MTGLLTRAVDRLAGSGIAYRNRYRRAPLSAEHLWALRTPNQPDRGQAPAVGSDGFRPTPFSDLTERASAELSPIGLLDPRRAVGRDSGHFVKASDRSTFTNRGRPPYPAPARPAARTDRFSPDQRVMPEPGGRAGAAVDLAGLLNDLGDWNKFLKDVRIYNDFKAAGGPDAVVTASPDSFTPLISRDISGGIGIRMQNGDEFWSMRLHTDPRPAGFNVQIRKDHNVRQVGDTVLWYKYDGSNGWTTIPPRRYSPPNLPRWLDWLTPDL